MYQIRLIDTCDELQQWWKGWNALAAAHSFPSVFLTCEWLHTWWQEVGSRQGGTHLYVLLALDGDRLAGIAPFMEVEEDGEKVLRFLGDPYTDYHDVITTERHREEIVSLFLEQLQDERNRWDRIQLNCIPADSCFLVQARARGWLRTADRAACPVVQFSDPSDYRQLTGKKGQARNMRLLSGKGDLQCNHYFSGTEISVRFESYRLMHRQQWDGNPEAVGGFEDPLVSNFFAALIPALTAQGWLMFTELTLDAQPLAYYFSFLYGGRYWAYRPCYDTAMKLYSPGHIMLSRIIDYLHSRSCYTLDFLRGNYPYKYRYANDAQFICSLSS